ncbi:MAG: hypothetical protein WCP14_02860 [bacterium]
MNERPQTPSEVIESFQKTFPGTKEKDIREVITAHASNIASQEGREVAIKDYRAILKAYADGLKSNPYLLKEVFDTAYMSIKFDELLGPENASRFGDRVKYLVAQKNSNNITEIIIKCITESDSTDESELIMSIYDEIDKQVAELVTQIFYDDEIKEMFDDDPVLKNKIKEFEIDSISGLLRKMVGAGIEMYSQATADNE